MNSTKSVCGLSLVILGVLLALPGVVQAQSFTNNYGVWGYTTTNDSITITNYSGPGGDVTIPDRIPGTTNGLPVTCIGIEALGNCYGLTNVTIPNSVTNIGDYAFAYCYRLTSVIIPNGVTSIGSGAFGNCSGVTNVTIPSSVTSIENGTFNGCVGLTSVAISNGLTSIGEGAFEDCPSLRSVTIPSSVTSIGGAAFMDCTSLPNVTIGNGITNIGDYAFAGCLSLTSIYFQGNAPAADTSVFQGDSSSLGTSFITAYYLPGTTGWAAFARNTGIQTALWTLPNPLVLQGSVGVQSNQFGFIVSWATNLSVVVEASSDLRSNTWTPVLSKALNNGVVNVTDPDWKAYPCRFYRVSSQ